LRNELKEICSGTRKNPFQNSLPERSLQQEYKTSLPQQKKIYLGQEGKSDAEYWTINVLELKRISVSELKDISVQN
jgi:hypothetical protein